MSPPVLMIAHGMTILTGEPQALGLPEASKCVGTTSGACLTNQIISPHTTRARIRKATSKMVPSFVLYTFISSFIFLYRFFSSLVFCRFFLGRRLALRKASVMIHCSWPLVLRNSSAAHASIAFIVSVSTRRIKLFVFLSAIF